MDGSDSDAGNVVFLEPECLVDTMPYLTVREHYHDFKRAGDVLVNMDRLREQSCNLCPIMMSRRMKVNNQQVRHKITSFSGKDTTWGERIARKMKKGEKK